MIPFARIDRYVLREMLVPLLAGTVVIAAVFVANDAIAIFKNFNLEQVPAGAVFQLLALRLPYWLGFTLPAGMAMASSLAVSRLVRDSEVTAMRASGYPIRRLLVPVMLAGMAVSVANFYLLDRLGPIAAQRYRKLIGEVGLLAAAPRFQSNVFLQLQRYSCSFGTVQRADDGSVTLTDALLIERPAPGEFVVYTAASGRYAAGVWSFRDPIGWWLKGETLQFVSRGELTINEPIRLAELFAPPAPEEQSTASLREALATARRTGAPTRELETAVWQKVSVPASCAVFAALGLWLSVRLARRGAFVGLFAGLVCLVLYFNAHVVSGEVLGRSGLVPPWLAAWLPFLAFAALAAGLAWRAE
jgi:lipopolysaccharide export system permease protein